MKAQTGNICITLLLVVILEVWKLPCWMRSFDSCLTLDFLTSEKCIKNLNWKIKGERKKLKQASKVSRIWIINKEAVPEILLWPGHSPPPPGLWGKIFQAGCCRSSSGNPRPVQISFFIGKSITKIENKSNIRALPTSFPGPNQIGPYFWPPTIQIRKRIRILIRTRLCLKVKIKNSRGPPTKNFMILTAINLKHNDIYSFISYMIQYSILYSSTECALLSKLSLENSPGLECS